MAGREELLQGLKGELQSERLLPSLTLGMLIGVTELIFALSVGSLIFSGELTSFLAYGIGIALVTTTVMLMGVSLGSAIAGVTGSLQDSPSAILAVLAATLIATLPAAQAEARLATVLAAIACTALLTGIFFLLLGYFKLGELVRFLPYPVVGGFLAGTGWLLVRGSFGVMAGFSLSIVNLAALFQADQLALWIPGVVFALILFFSLRRSNHFLVMPGVLALSIAVYYLALLARGISVSEAMEQGLLLGQVSGQASWQAPALKHLLAADWEAILGQSGNIAVILVVSVVSLLLNASALELTFRKDIDLNRELRVAGLANIVSGLIGGAVGYHALDISTLSHRTRVQGRLPGIVAGAFCAAALVAGTPLLAFFPKPILGGLLFFMGLGFLVEWLVDGWFKLPHADYMVVLLILVVIGSTNFLVGVGVGLLVMIVLFALRYSRINVVRHALSGAEIKSNVERCAYYRRVLRELGQHTYILKLQGYIFFGTANALLEQIRARVNDPEQASARYIILDFRRVTGLDSSAVINFVKGKQLVEARGISLLLTSISDEVECQFKMGGLFDGIDGSHPKSVQTFVDLDHGLEWCENQLLEIEMVTKVFPPATLQDQLQESGFAKAQISRLTKFLEKVQVDEGEYLIRQGDDADDLYFIELGEVSVRLELEGDKHVRLQTLDMGTVVGEMGLYLETMRSASVVADSPTIAYRLSRSALLEMREKEPELAAAFNEFVIRLLSERLVASNRLLEAVLR